MIINFIKGVLIGVSNIIPGVSGGTFALILGIYDRIIYSLNSFFSLETIRVIRKRKNLYEYFQSSGGKFLFQLLAGIMVSLVSLSWFIGFLIHSYPGEMLSFFLGLILSSVAVPLSMVKSRSFPRIMFIFLGILSVLVIYLGSGAGISGSGPGLVAVFLSGALVISAMVLPGLSGSFILLLMGSYAYIVETLRDASAGNASAAGVILVFGLGCFAGLVVFTRLMKFLLSRFRDKTLYFLTGLVLGSVVVLWPFKDYHPDVDIVRAENVIPSGSEIYKYGFFLILGALSSTGLRKLAKNRVN